MNERMRRKRERLYREQRGKCYWCGVMMRIGEKWRPSGRAEPTPTYATIEHLDSRLSGERGGHSGEKRLVLACLKCNHNRASREVEESLLVKGGDR